MTEPIDSRLERVRRLLEAAGRIAAKDTPWGARARGELPAVTGLSLENVEFALAECLETEASEAMLRRLVSSAGDAPRAHVLMASNVFTAPVRAIALGLCQTSRVDVRPSRREPLFTELLHDASHGIFRIVSELTPAPGDHVWAYGSDETLETVRGELPAGVVFHGHGSGFGVAVLELSAQDTPARVSALARALARDVAVFDQRGCASPRIALVVASEDVAESFASELARALAALHHDVPPGVLSPDEAADAAWYRDTLTYARVAFPAGKGVVGFDREGELNLPPVGRNVHVSCVADPALALLPLASWVTSIGVFASEKTRAKLREAAPGARLCEVGTQQKPPLDGPVDLRAAEEVL